MPPRDSQSSPDVPSSKDLTVKQQRDERRATKVAALKKKQATEKRHRMIGIVISSVAAVGVLALIIVMVVTNGTPRTSPDAIEIDGLQNYPNLVSTHVTDTVDYEQSPPGGR